MATDQHVAAFLHLERSYPYEQARNTALECKGAAPGNLHAVKHHALVRHPVVRGFAYDTAAVNPAWGQSIRLPFPRATASGFTGG